MRIALNEPASVTDPASGRCYRLYQESYRGPFLPAIRDILAGVQAGRGEGVFLSVLTVNYDPGRPLKYAGTLLVFFGFPMVYWTRKGKRGMMNDE